MTNTAIEQAENLLSSCWDAEPESVLGGTHCIVYRNPPVTDNDKPSMKHIIVNSVREGVRKAYQLSEQGKDTYFAMARFQQGWYEDELAGKKRFRTQENVASLQSFWFDIDCGKEKARKGLGYVSKYKAAKKLGKFVKRYGLSPPTYIVDSGNGFHVYWIFDATIDKARWDNLTTGLKKKASEFGLRIDNSRTTDCSSILRIPGTKNYKNKSQPVLVRILRHGGVCKLDELEVALSKALEGVDPHDDSKRSQVFDALKSRALEESEENIALIKEMLDALSADCDRDTWLKIVFAVASLGWACGKELAREWSMTAPDAYKESAFEELWKSYKPGHEDGITVGSLIFLATEAGWVHTPTKETSTDLTQCMNGAGGDIFNGKLFAHIYKNKLVYVPELNTWLSFDVSVGWVKAPYGEVERAAKDIVQHVREHAMELFKKDPQSTQAKRLMAFAERSSTMPKIREMINAAKSEPGMTQSLNDFDADPMQIGLTNGVLDLLTQSLLSISPDLLVTKRCSVAYDAASTCPQFDKYLAEVQPDPVIRVFLQRFVGYLLTGSVDEQVFVFFYGLGANGKSVFIELLAWLMGDYSRKIPTEMLMYHQRSPQGPSPDIVALKGIRMAHANETDEGRRLAEARVKDLTGGDSLTGRVPYAKADITFQPTHTIIMVGNHKPEIADTSNGMWRRVLLVNWGTTIPDNRQDKQLLEKLKSEGPGILNWALEGLRKWKQSGLQIPKQIRAATQEYRDEQDIIGEWLAEDCNTECGRTEEKKRLYQAYQRWTRINGHYPLAQGRLTRRLNERGYKLQRDKRTVTGLALKPEIRGLCS